MFVVSKRDETQLALKALAWPVREISNGLVILIPYILKES
jgi:hypothetical protein